VTAKNASTAAAQPSTNRAVANAKRALSGLHGTRAAALAASAAAGAGAGGGSTTTAPPGSIKVSTEPTPKSK
jgi:hypothetical protein